MAKKEYGVPITIRLDREILAQADELAKVLRQDPELSWARHSRSATLRHAVIEGLKVLRRRHMRPGKKKRGKP